MIPEIAFGTDGWRGVIAEDFTFANARVVTHAIARYVVLGEDARRGVIVGYDHRYASDRVAAAVAEVICASGTPVWLADKPCPAQGLDYLPRTARAVSRCARKTGGLEAPAPRQIAFCLRPHAWSCRGLAAGAARPQRDSMR